MHVVTPVISIREAESADVGRIAELAESLGYPVNPGILAGRLERLRASEGDLILVATDSPEGVVGWLHAHLVQYLESEFRVEIAGLVVAARFQRRGVGRKLVDHVIPWATRQGALEMSVRCQTWRVDAHGFYERLGFLRTKSQHVFRRRLGAG